MGRWWSIFSGISVLSHYPLWQNVLDPRMHAVRVNRLDWNWTVDGHNSCADPESFVKGDPTLTTFVFKVDGEREDTSPTLTLNVGFAAAIFQGTRTCIARKSYIFCDFSGWGSGPGFAHVISRYFGTYNVRQRLRRACASVHFQYSTDGSGMSSITAFMLNELILCLTTQTTTWKKDPFVYKFV